MSRYTPMALKVAPRYQNISKKRRLIMMLRHNINVGLQHVFKQLYMPDMRHPVNLRED